MIYIVSSEPFASEKIVHLRLNKIDFLPFDIDFSDFSALVLTSKHALAALKFNKIEPNDEIKVFCIGSGCADAAREFGFARIIRSNAHSGDEFATLIAPQIANDKVLFLRGLDVVSRATSILRGSCKNLSVVIAYENAPLISANLPMLEPNSVVIFTAPSSVRNFLANFAWRDDLKAVCIGETTARAVGFTTPFIAKNPSLKDCVTLAFEIAAQTR